MIKKTIVFITLSLFFLFSDVAEPVLAQKQALGVFPPITKIRTKSGQEISTPIKVKNLTDRPIEAQIILKPFKADEDGKVNLILYKDYTAENSSILKNVKLLEDGQSISNIVLSPKQEEALSLNIKTETNQKPQDFYFSIIFIVSPNDKTENSYSNVRIGIASNILLAIGNNSNLSISDFSSPLFTGEGNLKFSAQIENSGDNYATIHPLITIKNIFGKTIEVIETKEENLLAKASKTLGEDSGVIVSKEKYFVGPYTATIELRPTSPANSVSKSLSVFVMPGLTSFLSFAIILLILALFIKIRRKTR